MKKLKFYKTSNVDELVYPEEKQNISLETPALEFFTDFYNVTPLVIDSSTPVTELKELMMKAHVRLKFVVDENNHFVGIISTSDITDRKIVKKVSDGFKRDELKAMDLMRSKRDLIALDISDIEDASIGDIIRVLKENGHQHCLVMDHSTHKIRGIFSASDISRSLQLPVDIQDSSSFYKVFSATE